eukprot:3051577-Rhodomonas_salina.1
MYKHSKHVKLGKAAKKHAKANKNNWQQMLLESDLETEDNFLDAFGNEELHLDYAHSIALGYHKERYYLLFVVGCRNFLWATPTTTRMQQEELLQDFLTLTNLKVGKVHMDNKFPASSAFEAFCRKHSIAVCPSAAYTHTMQARAEGAVRICKEHV